VLDTSAKVQDAKVSYPMSYKASHYCNKVGPIRLPGWITLSTAAFGQEKTPSADQLN
jgi:hypothetical protein